MAKLNRILQKIFGENGATTEFGVIGSENAGSPATTKDLATIQSLSQFTDGLYACTNDGNEPPRIEDINALYFMITSQLRYLFQNGIPEWHAGAEYYAVVSYCQKDGVIYRSVTNDNVNHDPATDDGTYWEAGDSSIRQLKFDLDRLGFSGYALYTDKYLRDKLSIARRSAVGQYIIGGVSQVPTAFAAAQSTAHPTYPEYCPLIPIHDANHDVTTTETPQWVIDKFLAEKVSLAGTTSWTATLSTGVLTFGAGAANDLFLDFIQEQGYVNRWYVAESAGWLASGTLFTGARQQALTIANAHFAVDSMNRAGRTVTLATYPANGSVSVEFHPYAIGGSLTSFRLRRISGEALVAAGDITGEIGIGANRMYRLLGHRHSIATAGGGTSPRALNDSTSNTGSSTGIVVDPVSDTVNSLVTGKTNDPRTAGVAVYVNVGVLLATSYTST